MPQRIVIGQRVASVKIGRAKRLRHHMTPAETLLWNHLRTNKFGGLHFRRQQLIAGFIVDFYCHSKGVVIEVDGSIHEQQIEYDAERDLALSQHGLAILRFRNEEIQDNLEDVLARIAVACGISASSALQPKDT